MGDEGGRGGVINRPGSDGAVVWFFSAVKIHHHAHPEQRCRFWKRARLRLGARDYREGFPMQVDVHVPLVVSVVIVVDVEADDRVHV